MHVQTLQLETGLADDTLTVPREKRRRAFDDFPAIHDEDLRRRDLCWMRASVTVVPIAEIRDTQQTRTTQHGQRPDDIRPQH